MTDENTDAADSIDSDGIPVSDAIRYHLKRITSEAVSDPEQYGERSRFYLDGYRDTEAVAWRSVSTASDDMGVLMGLVMTNPSGMPVPKPFAQFDVPSINRFIAQGLNSIRCIDSNDDRVKPLAKPSPEQLSNGQQVLDDRGVAVLLRPLENENTGRIQLSMIPSESASASASASESDPEAVIVADFSPPAVEAMIGCAIDARNELQGTETPLQTGDQIIDIEIDNK